MSRTLSTQSIWTIVSAGVLVLVLGYSAYNYFNMPTGSANATKNQYSLGVVQEMQATSAGGKANVFEKAALLHDIPQSQGENVQYNPSDLGKTDLSHPE
jgi:hypothetical protein